MRYTITISPDTDTKLQERARAHGTPAEAYLQELVQHALDRPSLRETLAPIHQEFLRSGMSEGELDVLLSDAMEESRRERRARRGA